MLCNRCAETKKKYGPNERIDQNSRKNTTKWWRNSQPIRDRVQNPGNQDAHRNGWVWLQIEENVKAMNSEGKENVQDTNSEGKETGTQINPLEQKEEINIQPE